MTLDEIITPQTVKLVQGEGMPIAADTSVNVLDHLKPVSHLSKGDLYIKFDILFPKKLHHHYKQAILKALRDNEEESQ